MTLEEYLKDVPEEEQGFEMELWVLWKRMTPIKKDQKKSGE